MMYKPIFPSRDLKYSPTYKNPYNKVNGFSVIGQLFGQMPDDPWLKAKYISLGLKGHNGLDIACLKGTPIFSSHSGKVVKLSEKISNGLGITIQSDDDSFQTMYWHLDKILVKLGQKVRALDLIGLADSTGLSTGNHLHFGKYPIGEPKDNGYSGAVDPLPDIIETPKFYFDGNLFLGIAGEDVRNLQIALAYEGFLGQVGFAGFTGYFGTQTFDGVKKFQKKYDISDTGFVGALTRKKLNEIFV